MANAIYDGTSCIMLSGETAAGKYPVEALETMVRIAEKAEESINYIKRFNARDNSDVAFDVTNAISPRHLHHRPRPGGQGHHHRDEIRRHRPAAFQIPALLPHCGLHHRGERLGGS